MILLIHFLIYFLINFSFVTSLPQRINCYPEIESPYSNYSKESCLSRHCLYDDNAKSAEIQCYLSSNYGYILQNIIKQTKNNLKFKLKRNQAIDSPFPEPFENVLLEIEYYTNQIIRFKLYDADKQRYEVPIPLTAPDKEINAREYDFSYSSDQSRDNLFSFSIKRRDDKSVLFDTSLGGLVLNNQFLQIITRLQSTHVYGFGENNHDTLKHNVHLNTSWGIFARDQGTNWDRNANHYGHHPFYVVMEENLNNIPTGRMHGVLLLNSNAMDYSFDSTPSLTIRTIGGILDFFLFVGPNPEQVIQQYTSVIGRPFFPPYWSLGFQLSRWDYSNLTYMKMINKRNRNIGIPFDVQYADIDYMDKAKVFTVDPINYKGLNEYFQELNSMGIRTIIILDPGMIDDQKSYLPTIEGIKQNLFIKWNNGSLVRGAVWPGPVFFPDFFKKETQHWWQRWITHFRSTNLTFDGLWIDMNEPALFDTNNLFPWNWNVTESDYTLKCPQNQWEDPPYRTKAVYRWDKTINRTSRLSDRTLCMSAIQQTINPITGQTITYRHYDVHSLYGWSQTKPTLDIIQKLTNKRSLVLPRSTFVGSGQWAGHWLGDNEATWHEMKRSIIGMIEFNWFGIPYIGADICGFEKTPTEEMCIRWMQLGAFYPFSRNHNIWKRPDQDPGAWSPVARSIMIKALRIRYELLPYYYTLFYKSHTTGSTVIRPLFHQYPKDKQTYEIYLQFLIGSDIMIAPVTDPGVRQVEVYIPSLDWFDYYNGQLYLYEKQYRNISTPLDKIPIFLKSGSIIPTQEYANNTKYSRLNPFGLIISLNCNGSAEGDLFYDDGESIDTIQTKDFYYSKFEWSSTNQLFQLKILTNNYSLMSKLFLNQMIIYGLKNIPSKIYFNKKQFYPKIRSFTQIVQFTDLEIPMDQSFILTWSDTKPITIQTPEILMKNPKYHIDCSLKPDSSSDECYAHGCIYNSQRKLTGSSSCYIPIEKGGYKLVPSSERISNNKIQYNLSRLSRKPAVSLLSTNQLLNSDNDINNLNVEISVSDGNMIRLTIRNSENDQYEVPRPIQWKTTSLFPSIKPKIEFEMTKTSNEQVGFRIKRTDTQSVIFDTSLFAHGFIYQKQLIQFLTTVPSTNIYGFGGNRHKTFRHELKNSFRYGRFARNQSIINENEHLSGRNSFYMSIEPDGNAFGIFILNSNAYDYKIEQFENDQSLITYRTDEPILDIFFFAGPKPEDVIKQYQSVIGYPSMPPYWTLAFQLAQYAFKNIQQMKTVVQRILDQKIPVDIVYTNTNYSHDKNPFTWDSKRFKGLPEYIDWLHKQGMKLITVVDTNMKSDKKNLKVSPQSKEDHLWFQLTQTTDSQNKKSIESVKSYGKIVNLGHFSPSTKEWWKNRISNFYKKIKFDGVLLNKNESPNMDTNKFQQENIDCSTNEKLNNPRYKISINEDYSFDKTLCITREHQDDRNKLAYYYDIHNLHGSSQILSIVEKLENRRSIILSESTYPTTGKSNDPWSKLKSNIIGILEFNLFGIPYVGTDICNYSENQSEQLCQRWMQLGAFNPLFRYSNGRHFIDQDSEGFYSSVTNSNRHIIEIRYELNPYLYTLFHHVHISGGTVVRSMAHLFPLDSVCLTLDEQFLWGSHLLIAPVIYENHTMKTVYFPLLNERWFNYYTGEEQIKLGFQNVTANYDYLPLFVRGGSILPRQQSAMNTIKSRLNPMNLLIALDKQDHAEGNLFWDDGQSIDTYQNLNYNYFSFKYDKQRLIIEPWKYYFFEMTYQIQLEHIIIYGLKNKPSNIDLNEKSLSKNQWTFNTTYHVLYIQKLFLNFSQSHQFSFS